MLKPIVNLAKGKLRVLGYCSGSGNTLWKTYELQKEMDQTLLEGCPFEIVGIFTDNPKSNAIALAEHYNIPWESIDIKEYYSKFNKPLRDMEVRAQFDAEAMELLDHFGAEMILLAGYVWAITDIVLDNYLVVNVHPADLAVTDKAGHRLLAGSNGIKSAFKHKMKYLRASSHIATKEVDSGPLLVRSPKVPVNYALHEDEDTRFRYYLKLVNEQGRLVGARTVLELALGNFAIDEKNIIHYRGEMAPTGLLIENWEKNKPTFQRKRVKILNPESVVVIGASNRTGIGKAIVQNLKDIGFKGKVHVVNLKGEDVLGYPGHTSISDVPAAVDLGVIAVPSTEVLSVAEECGEKSVPALVCITAGFREIGGEGIQREKDLMKIVDRYNMCLIGPNCMGVANTSPDVRLSATILSSTPPIGNVAFLTQSGALGASIIDFADELDVGFSVIVSLGNMAHINHCDLLPLLEADDNTKIICMYMESLPEPYRFERVMANITKPVIMVKSARSIAGSAAANSHTGSLACNDKVADALLKKCGVIRVESLEDAFLLASAMTKMPKIRGNRVGVISNTGGLATLITDALIKYGFDLPQLDDYTRNTLAQNLLPEASTFNPLDLVAPAPPAHYALATNTMIKSGMFDAIIVACVPPATIDTGEVAEAIVDILKSTSIPVFSCFFGPKLGAAGRATMKSGGIPTFSFPDQMVRTMRYMVEPEAKEPQTYDCKVPMTNRTIAKKLLKSAKENSYLGMDMCFNLLELYHIPVAKYDYITCVNDISKINIIYPVVAKVDHPNIIHKSDVGGVHLGIKNEEELRALVAEWQAKFAGLHGIHLQRQVTGSVEMIIGAFFDPALGHSIMTGLGGTMVEVFQDVSFGHVPLSASDPDRMLDSLLCKRLLTGYRGSKGVNISQFKNIIMHVNQFLLDFPCIVEMDINPLIYVPEDDRFIAVDVRIKLF